MFHGLLHLKCLYVINIVKIAYQIKLHRYIVTRNQTHGNFFIIQKLPCIYFKNIYQRHISLESLIKIFEFVKKIF